MFTDEFGSSSHFYMRKKEEDFDPDEMDEHDSFYQTTKSLLFLFQIMGVMPINRSPKGEKRLPKLSWSLVVFPNTKAAIFFHFVPVFLMIRRKISVSDLSRVQRSTMTSLAHNQILKNQSMTWINFSKDCGPERLSHGHQGHFSGPIWFILLKLSSFSRLANNVCISFQQIPKKSSTRSFITSFS